MTRFPLAEVSDDLAGLAERVVREGTPIVLTRGRKKAVALVPADLLAALEDAADAADLRRALAQPDDGPTVAWEDLKAELAL